MNTNDLVDELYKPESKIYNYLKKRPSVAIAVVSLGITVCSSFVNLILFFSDQLYLQEWGWSMREIEWTPSGMIHNVLIGLGLIIAICYIQVIVFRRFEEARFLFYSYWCTTFITHKKMQELEDLKSAGIKVKRGYTKITVSDLLEELKRNKTTLTNNLLIKALLLVRDVLPSIMIIVLLAFLIFSSIRDVQSQIVIGLSVLYPILFMVFIVSYKALMEKRKITKSLNDVDDMNLYDLEYSFEVKRIEREKEIRQSKSTYSLLFYDDNVILFIRVFLASVVALILSAGLLFGLSQNGKRALSICKYDNESYMIVFQNSEVAYLDKIEFFSEKEVVIDTSSKRIIRTGDLKYETNQYERIEKIKAPR